MKIQLQLSPNENDALAEILASLSERAKRPLSLDTLLDKWSHFVIQVEQGYEDSIYEYTNDLSVRDLLDETLSKVPPSLHEKLVQEIQIWDKRFQEATREVRKPLLSSGTRKLLPWWSRIPKNLRGELKEDLQVEGLLG